LPGRQRRRFAGVGRARAAIPGQGTHCYDFNLCRVFYANSRTWMLKGLSRFYYKSVQSLRKSLENCRKKIHKNAKPSLLVSGREIPQLLLF
jgi:hypothetical protein